MKRKYIQSNFDTRISIINRSYNLYSIEQSFHKFILKVFICK